MVREYRKGKDQRSYRFTFRLSPVEMESLWEVADSRGKNPSEFIRGIILRVIEKDARSLEPRGAIG